MYIDTSQNISNSHLVWSHLRIFDLITRIKGIIKIHIKPTTYFYISALYHVEENFVFIILLAVFTAHVSLSVSYEASSPTETNIGIASIHKLASSVAYLTPTKHFNTPNHFMRQTINKLLQMKFVHEIRYDNLILIYWPYNNIIPCLFIICISKYQELKVEKYLLSRFKAFGWVNILKQHPASSCYCHYHNSKRSYFCNVCFLISEQLKGRKMRKVFVTFSRNSSGRIN